MASFNKVMLIGNLTRDPQLRYTLSQTAVVEFGIATNRKWKDQTGQQREEVCFVDCVSFGKPAETLNKYMSKGKSIFLEGRLTYDSWTGQDGAKKSRLRVTVDNFQFLSSASGSPSGQVGSNSNYTANNNSNDIPAQVDDIPEEIPSDDIPF
jgi:single-strand DNA-binding protein